MKILYGFLVVFISVYAIQGIAKETTTQVSADPVDPLIFAAPVPTFPRNVVADDSETVQFTLQNTGDASLKLYPHIEAYHQHSPVMRRININQVNDCGSDGSTLNPGGTCTLTYAVEVTDQHHIGSTLTQELKIDYTYKHTKHELSSLLNINVVQASLSYTTDESFLSPYITKCKIDSSTGFLSGCINASDSLPLSFTFGLAFTTINDTTFAFIDHSITTQCALDNSTNVLISSSCVNQIIGSNNNSGVAFNTSDQLYAYIADFTGNNVNKCKVDLTTTNFKLYSCAPQNPIINGPRQITFQKIGDATYVYIGYEGGNTASKVVRCEVNSHGDFKHCTTTGGLNTPNGGRSSQVAFVYGKDHHENIARAYVTYLNGSYECSVDQHNGDLKNCKNIGNLPFNSPEGTTNATINGQQYLYIANGDPTFGIPNMIQCALKNSGALDICSLYTPTVKPTFALALR